MLTVNDEVIMFELIMKYCAVPSAEEVGQFSVECSFYWLFIYVIMDQEKIILFDILAYIILALSNIR